MDHFEDQFLTESHEPLSISFEEEAKFFDPESVSSLPLYVSPNTYPKHIRPTLRDAVSYLAAEHFADTAHWRPEQSNEFYRLLSTRDFMIAMTKGFTFGLIIALVGCWRGYRTQGGAEGVGNAPTSSVVTSSLWILIADFFLTKLLLV